MSRFGCLLFMLVACDGVFSTEEQKGFVQELDFSPIFDAGRADKSAIASDPVAAAILKADNSLLPHLYDTASSGTLDAIQKRSAPNNVFSSEHFGFNPIASQGFRPLVQSAKLKAAPRPHHNPLPQPIRQQANQLYDIRTVHDADYKVYKPEEEQGEEILAALKKNPTVANYFQPGLTNIDVAHPVKYRREEAAENLESDFKPNHYLPGPSRIRRYAGGRKHKSKKRSEEEEDDPYDYSADYVSRPKAFDGSQYSSAYKEEKDPNKDYEYPYGYDSAYDHKEYDRIKDLSEKQAAEIKQNPGNCQESKKDGMTCMVCKDPKTGGNYESCSYVQEPKNNKYAYSKEKKFDSNDEPDEPEGKNETPKKTEKYQEQPSEENKSKEYVDESAPEKRHAGNYRKADDEEDSEDDGKYKAYYNHRSNPTPSESITAADDRESSDESSDSVVSPYNYKKAIPELYTDNEPKKDVEHVLAEFKKKDRSSCKKVYKNGMTCFQCIDKHGLKNEECMFVSESAPKQSHLAYQEVKEFTSKPATLDGAESLQVTTNAPQPQRSAAYVVANSNYGKKLKRKKAPQVGQAAAASNVNPTASVYIRKVKRSVDEEEEAEERAAIVDQTNVAPPEEFAGENSKGAYWSETMPRYSAALGVTLPEYMLARSEHEASFDEAVSGA